jgi:antitoxin component YwqK of YwqJK toxin-antitoxin module
MNGEYIEYYENGQVHSICSYIDNQKHGKYEQYYENGNPWKICYYKNGKLIN